MPLEVIQEAVVWYETTALPLLPSSACTLDNFKGHIFLTEKSREHYEWRRQNGYDVDAVSVGNIFSQKKCNNYANKYNQHLPHYSIVYTRNFKMCRTQTLLLNQTLWTKAIWNMYTLNSEALQDIVSAHRDI